MCDKCGKNEDLHKIQDEARAMFVSFCNAHIAHQEPQREDSVEEVPAIGKGRDFNTTIMKEVVTNLHGAHKEFKKIQPKQ